MLSARTDAAGALVCLAARMETLTDEHKGLLRQVAEDTKRDLRFQVAENFWPLLKKWPEFVWETLERWVAELPSQPENNEVLLMAMNQNWFWRLQDNDSIRANQFLRKLLAAAQQKSSKELKHNCGSWLAALGFWKGELWACEILYSEIDNIRDNSEELEGALNVALGELLPRTKKMEPPSHHQQARNFLLTLLDAASRSVQLYETETASLPISNRPVEPPSWAEQVYYFFIRVLTEFRVSAEEHAKQWSIMDNNQVNEQMIVWWETVEPILDSVIAIPNPQIAYDLVEGLRHIIWFDVERGLHWLRKVTLASAPYGLSTEQLAADKTLKILERILAEHKIALGAEESRSDFVQTLEAYLQIGWPKAISLAVHLDSIFR